VPVPEGSVESIADFVIKQLDRYPIIGIGEVHTCLEFHQILHELMRDPRLPGKVNDIIVEFGNPSAQEVTDRYVLEGEAVPRDARKTAWQNTAIGWTISVSPLYEYFFDVVREVNAKLPLGRRIRIVLGDAPLDVARLRVDPAGALQMFRMCRESPISAVREAALAESVDKTISLGHRGLIIAGSGHLRGNGLPGSARQLIDKQHPGKLLYMENVTTAAPGVAMGSVIVQGEQGSLFIGDVGASQSSVRISPLIFRDPEFWHDINLANWATNKEWVDLARPEFEYRGRYFEKPWPQMFDAMLGIHPR
jgi:hypothetical protein